MNQFFLWGWILLMIMVIFMSAENYQKKLAEGFTPKIRSLYRPHIRNLRIYSETFANKYSNYFIPVLKKMGLY